MSLLKVNEVQNFNGSSLTLTASTVSTSAQLNTGGNISVTGSLNVSDDSTTRTNLGLGTISTQDSNNVNLTGGTIGSSVVFPAGHIVQTVFNTHAAESVFSSNTPTAVTNLTKSINLKTNNPYILVILALNSVGKVASNTSLGIRLTADDSGSLDIKLSDMLGYSNDTQYNFGSGFQAYLHNLTSDTSGSTITYTPKFYSTANSANAIINGNFTGFGQHSQIILMEIQK